MLPTRWTIAWFRSVDAYRQRQVACTVNTRRPFWIRRPHCKHPFRSRRRRLPSSEENEPSGELIQTVTVPAKDEAGLGSATNVAIEPGTTEAYITVSGTDGGFLYSFRALGKGIRQSNGG